MYGSRTNYLAKETFTQEEALIGWECEDSEGRIALRLMQMNMCLLSAAKTAESRKSCQELIDHWAQRARFCFANARVYRSALLRWAN